MATPPVQSPSFGQDLFLGGDLFHELLKLDGGFCDGLKTVGSELVGLVESLLVEPS